MLCVGIGCEFVGCGLWVARFGDGVVGRDVIAVFGGQVAGGLGQGEEVRRL